MDIKANAKANMKLTPVDLNGELITTENASRDQKRIIKLIERPNPIQGTWEFLRLVGLYKEIWGRSFVYANVPAGFDINGTNIATLMPLPSQYMRPIYTGRLFDQNNRSDIIKRYELRYNGMNAKTFEPNTILDRSDSDVSFFDDIYGSLGISDLYGNYNVNSKSKLLSVKKEITNYILSLEGRNITTKKLGARGILTSGKKDGMGSYPLTDKERESAQARLDNYGAMEDQKQYIVASEPLLYQNIAFSPKDLMLHEETYQTMITIAQVTQVPEGLVRLYMSGSGKEAEKELLKRLYTQTIIPESKDTADDLNEFLKTEKFGMRFKASFDHLDFLQEDKKDESIKNRNINIAYRDMFKSGTITYNQWLEAMGLPSDPEFGDKRIWDLSTEQQAIITGNIIQDVPKK